MKIASLNTFIRSVVVSLVAVLSAYPATAGLPGRPATMITLGSIEAIFISVISYAWMIFAGLTIVMFLYAGALFLTAAGNETKLATAKRAVIWGVIGIATALTAFMIDVLVRQVILPP